MTGENAALINVACEAAADMHDMLAKPVRKSGKRKRIEICNVVSQKNNTVA
jgi:hypothetical protein